MQRIKDFWNKNKTSKIIIIIGGLIIFCCICSIFTSFLPKSETAPALGADAIFTQAFETALAEYDQEAPENQPEEPPTSENTPIPATAIILSPEDALKESIREALGELNRDGNRIHEIDIRGDNNDLVSVRFSLNDNFSDDSILRVGMLDIIDILKAVNSSSIDYSIVIVEGTFLMVDTYGNESEEQVIFASYSKENIDLINWSNFLTDNIFVIADTHNLHPAFDN